MATLAQRVAAAGHPVFRFDRRGIGDSEGENHGFEGSGPDIAAAIGAFCGAAPHVTRIVAFGNCDAASALLLHQPLAIDALVLANPWTYEAADEIGRASWRESVCKYGSLPGVVGSVKKNIKNRCNAK